MLLFQFIILILQWIKDWILLFILIVLLTVDFSSLQTLCDFICLMLERRTMPGTLAAPADSCSSGRWKWALQFAEDTFSDFRCYEQGATVTWWGTKKLARNLKRIVNKILQKNMFSFDFDCWKSKAKCWKNLNTKLRVRIKILCWQFFSYLHLAGLETTLSHNLNSNFCWEV